MCAVKLHKAAIISIEVVDVFIDLHSELINMNMTPSYNEEAKHTCDLSVVPWQAFPARGLYYIFFSPVIVAVLS